MNNYSQAFTSEEIEQNPDILGRLNKENFDSN